MTAKERAGCCVHVVVAAKAGLAVEASTLELISTLARPPKVVHTDLALHLLYPGAALRVI
jgi:hypothetical protein